MDVFSQRLAAVYQRLVDSDLVKTKSPTAANVEKFKKTLNMAVSVSDYENTVGEVGRFFHKTNRFSFLKFLSASGLQHFVLTTDGFPIVKQLGLTGVVNVKWNRVKKEFDVTVGAGPEDDGSQPQHRKKFTRREGKEEADEPASSGLRRTRSDSLPQKRDYPKKPSRNITPLSHIEVAAMVSALKASSIRVDNNVKSHKEVIANTPPSSVESSPHIERKSPQIDPQVWSSDRIAGSWADVEDSDDDKK